MNAANTTYIFIQQFLVDSLPVSNELLTYIFVFKNQSNNTFRELHERLNSGTVSCSYVV
jgi:hypothetical protein